MQVHGEPIPKNTFASIKKFCKITFYQKIEKEFDKFTFGNNEFKRGI
jgi:hypothetical protein